MEIKEVNSVDFQKIAHNNLTIFDSFIFNEYNKSNCEEIIFLLIYENNSPKFSIIGGIKDNAFNIPFSAPYSSINNIKKNIKLLDIYNALTSFLDFFKNSSHNIKSLKITLPPLFYSDTYLSMIAGSLNDIGFNLLYSDLNYFFNCDIFDSNYLNNLNIKPRQKLLSAIKLGLKFKKLIALRILT